jgi:tRNA nucleotidyltransferase (CCA-adding enzyme)
LIQEVLPLVEHHLKPRQLYQARASDAAVRRLARKVDRIDRLLRVARADSAGRPPIPAEPAPDCDWLESRAEALAVQDRAPEPLVLGRHLIARGLVPGPRFGPLLDRCFEAQLDGIFSDEAGALHFLDDLVGEEG